jgi:hypothetical protein
MVTETRSLAMTIAEVMLALNKFDGALRKAVRKDVMAEMAETWEPAKLRALRYRVGRSKSRTGRAGS